jgi:hypothetical protein
METAPRRFVVVCCVRQIHAACGWLSRPAGLIRSNRSYITAVDTIYGGDSSVDILKGGALDAALSALLISKS